MELRPSGVISLGKFGSFKVEGILGFQYGQSFEIIEDLKVKPINGLEAVSMPADNEAVDGEGAEEELTKDELTKMFSNSAENNQNIINIGSKIQKLTSDDVHELKTSGASSEIGQKIIEKMIAGHEGFDKKTIFSQEKYLKRKQQKFLRRFTVEYLGPSQLLQYYNEKDNMRVLDMSEESLGLLMSYGNIRPGGKYLVVDETGGLILYAMMERMKNSRGDVEGTIVVAHENEHANHIVLRYSPYSPEQISAAVKTINWLQFIEPENERIMWEELPGEELANLKPSKQLQYERRKKRAAEINLVIDLVTAGNFDAFICVGTLNLPTLLPYVLPTIFETRMRPYQTIPGRMHPHMTMRGYGGYVLWGTRVLPQESGITAIGRGIIRKREEAASASDVEMK